MATIKQVEGFDEFRKVLESIDPKGPPVFFYFSGSKLPDGTSWCSDCNAAYPVVSEVFNAVKENVIIIIVLVGNRAFWKDSNCPFKNMDEIKLLVIPTLVRYKGVQRLEGEQLTKKDLVEMMFAEDE